MTNNVPLQYREWEMHGVGLEVRAHEKNGTVWTYSRKRVRVGPQMQKRNFTLTAWTDIRES